MRPLLALIPLASFAGGAFAADMPIRVLPPVADAPVFSWAGFYSGLFAGYGQINTYARPACIGVDGTENGTICPVRTALSPKVQDFTAGSQIGYNHQITPGSGFIFGAAADYQFTPIRSYGLEEGNFPISGLSPVVYPNGAYHVGQRLDWLATARGKFGYTLNQLLIYGTGGAAIGDVRIDTTTTAASQFSSSGTNLLDYDGRKSNLRVGWVAGGGAEYAISPHLSVMGEILYYDLGSQTVLTAGRNASRANIFVGSRVDTSGVLGRVGLNYRFDDGLPIVGPAVEVTNALIDPVPYVEPLTQTWDFEIGTRYVYSTGSFRKSLYRSIDQTLISRLTYHDFDAHSGETFARLNNRPTGLFLKGFLGSGFVTSGGKLNDEDFTPGIPGNVYSNTLSKIRKGDVALSAIDVGYDLWRNDTYQLGGFIGYQSTIERVNAYGLFQLAANRTIGRGSLPNSVSVLTQDNHWNALRVGLAVEARYDRFKVSLEGAYLPVVGLDGYDRHWLRPDINPQAENGVGNGYFLQGVIAYALTPRISVGVGARYWRMMIGRSDGSARFPTLVEPEKPTSQRYGAFAQISYRFGDSDLGWDIQPLK